MWSDTRMVVLTAVTAAVYAAVLIPFKMIPLIPGTTELRPANSLPVVFSLLFGSAGAWGCAMGNLIGDTFGTLVPEEPARRVFPRTGIALVAVGVVGGILLGDYLSLSGTGLGPAGVDPLGWALLPALGLVALGAYLL